MQTSGAALFVASCGKLGHSSRPVGFECHMDKSQFPQQDKSHTMQVLSVCGAIKSQHACCSSRDS